MDLFKLVTGPAAARTRRPGRDQDLPQTLIDWLNTDPWPRDPRFGGPVLTPAVIERKLRVSAYGPGTRAGPRR